MELSGLAPTRIRKQQNDPKSKVTWSPEEDELLRSLVSDAHPNSWSAIAKYFPSKTAPQISGRWEKVVNPKLVKGSWTGEEDRVIIDFVLQNGMKDWAKLATLLPGRTGKQCRERWTNQLDPRLNRDNWTANEDLILLQRQKVFGNAWSRIAGLLPGRSSNAIKNRWCWLTRHQFETDPREPPEEAPQEPAPQPLWVPARTEPIAKVDPFGQEEEDFIWI
jgi:hypothetical protein